MKERFPFSFPLPQHIIVQKRASILAQLLAYDEGFCNIPVQSISQDSLRYMLNAYNAAFLNGCLKRVPVQVTLSSRLTSSAGKFICLRGAFGRIKQAEIRMSSDYLLRLRNGPFELNGLTAATPQEAFLLVFEHELCHAVETMLYGKTAHSPRFLSLANGLFGHTGTRHKLPTRQQEAAQKGLVVGSSIRFLCKGIELCGIVTYIGKTATVMVPSDAGAYHDRFGRKYTKYRVPLSKVMHESS